MSATSADQTTTTPGDAAPTAPAGAPTPPTSDVSLLYTDVIKGIDLIWNNEFTAAEKHFAKKDDPRHLLHNAEAVFLKSFITADTADTATALSRLELARKVASDHIAAYEKGLVPPGVTASKEEIRHKLLDARVVLGDSLYMTAILQLTRDSKVKGAFNLRKSWKTFEGTEKMLGVQSAQDDAELKRCVEFGAGLFYWAISIVPKNILKFIELAGFKSDRDLGMKYLRQAREAGGVRSSYATMVLLANNLILPRGVADITAYLKEADVLVTDATKKYPTGSLFQVMGSHLRRKQCDVDGGIEFMLKALDSCKSLGQEPLIYRYELACCYCMQLEFHKAAEIFEKLIGAQNFQVRAICAMQLAGCLTILNEAAKASAVFGKMPEFSKKGGSLDKQMARQAERFLKNGGHFAMFELLYMRRDLVKMNKYMSKALEILEAAAAKTKAKESVDIAAVQAAEPKGLNKLKGMLGTKKTDASPNAHHADDRASYLLIKGSMLKALEKHDEAIQCFRDVIVLKPVLKEKFYLPYALYELAESLYIANKLEEAYIMMKQCSSISGFDWEDPLKVRCRVVSDQINAARTKSGVVVKEEDEKEEMTEEEKAEAAAAKE